MTRWYEYLGNSRRNNLEENISGLHTIPPKSATSSPNRFPYDEIEKSSFDSSRTFSSKHGLEAQKKPRNLKRFALRWQMFIIAGQLLSLLFATLFLILAFTPRQIVLPDHIAEFIARSPSSVVIVSALVSTGLAGFSTYLFTHSIRYFLISKLSQPISLVALSAGIKLSQGAVQFRSNGAPALTATTILFSILLSTQIAAWTTLLSPTRIFVHRNLNSSEFDMNSPAFRNIYTTNFQLDSEYFDDDNTGLMGWTQRASTELLIASGSSAAAAEWSPNILNYEDNSYNGSTGGILPLDLVMSKSSSRFSVNKNTPQPKGFTTNYTMTQQGLTANVTCQLSTDMPPSNPPSIDMGWLQWDRTWNESITVPSRKSPELLRTFRVIEPTWYCPASGKGRPFYDYPSIVSAYNTPRLSAGWCSSQNIDGELDNRTAIATFIASVNALNFFPPNHDKSARNDSLNVVICAIQPLYTNVTVNYGKSPIDVQPTPEGTRRADQAQDLMVNSNLRMIRGIPRSAQTLFGNTMLDVILNLYASKTTEESTYEENAKLLTTIYENFIRGGIEFRSTWMRKRVQDYLLKLEIENPDQFAAMLPDLLPVSGSVHAATMGWEHKPIPALFALIPIWFVAIVSIAVTLYAIQINGKNHHDPSVFEFDPLDPVDLVFASAAGGLSSVEHQGMRQNGKTKLRFGIVDKFEGAGTRQGLVWHDDEQY